MSDESETPLQSGTAGPDAQPKADNQAKKEPERPRKPEKPAKSRSSSPLLALLNVAALAAIAYAFYIKLVDPPHERARDRVKHISSIVPLKVIVSDFAVVDSSGVKALYHIKGDALLGVDLSRATFEANEDGSISISGIEPPAVEKARVDGDSTELIDQKRGPFTSQKTVGELYDRVLNEAQARVGEAASQPTILKAAQRRSEMLISAFYARMGLRVSSFSWASREGSAVK